MGFQGKYLISSEGKVWNTHKEKWQELSAAGDYLKTTLTLGEMRQQLTIHRLVATHFLPNPNNHPIVNHIDGNKHNNHVSNLEWVCPVGNAQHALETGLRSGYMPVNIKRELLERVLTTSITISDLAKEIGRHPVVLSKMLRTQATKDGRQEDWNTWSKKARATAAINNLQKVNADSLTQAQVESLFQRACNGERIIDLAKEVHRHPQTLGALLRQYRKQQNIEIDFRSRRSHDNS